MRTIASPVNIFIVQTTSFDQGNETLLASMILQRNSEPFTCPFQELLRNPPILFLSGTSKIYWTEKLIYWTTVME